MTPDHDPLLDEPEFRALHDQLVAAAARRAAERAEPDATSPAADPVDADPIGAGPSPATPIADAPRRRNRRPLLAAAAAAIVAVVASVAVSIAVSSPDVAADVTVQRRGDRVRVVLEDTVTVEDVRAAMEREGLDVEVEPRVTGPSKRHRFLGGLYPVDVEIPAGSDGAVAEFEVGSRVTLALGVEGAPGETYDVQTDATGPGEVLDGIAVKGRPVAEVVPILDALTSVTVQYRGPDGQPTSSPPAAGTVLQVVAASDDELLAFVG